MQFFKTFGRFNPSSVLAAGMFSLVFSTVALQGAATTRPTTDPSDTQLPLHFTGGYDTMGQDRGRPVVLIASALGVPTEVFREAFTHVTPAGPGQQPQDDQVRKNKQALMEKLGPYGVTDERLNEVSNFYRYNRSTGQMWKHTAASGYATVHDGTISSIVLTNAGAGYSTPPTVTIDSMPDVHLTATLNFEKELKSNGSLKTVTTDPAENTTMHIDGQNRSTAP